MGGVEKVQEVESGLLQAPPELGAIRRPGEAGDWELMDHLSSPVSLDWLSMHGWTWGLGV